MSYAGDFAPASSVVFNFNTAAFSDGSPITLAGTPALSVYKNSTTESTSGVTLTVDYDSRTGMHHVVIDTSADGTFYAAGNDFSVVITAGTVGGTSVVGRVVGAFSLNNRSALRPATAGRQLVVDAAGLADACAVKVGPSGSGTAQTAGDIPARLPAALTAGGNMKSDPLAINGVSTGSVTTVKPVIGLTTADTISALANNTITAASLAADAGAEIATAIGLLTIDANLVKIANDDTFISVLNGLLQDYANETFNATITGVVGDVSGKIIGGGVNTIGGPGVWAFAQDGGDVAPASTALSNAVWTDAKAAFITGDAFDRIGVAGAGLTAITAKTDNLPASPAAVDSAMTLTSAYDFAKGTVAVTESYNADGAAPTPVQALMVIMQMLTEKSISSTTLTVKKLDGSTTAATFTLNDADAPTSITRAT